MRVLLPGKEKACRNCKRIVTGNVCDNCGSSNLTTNFTGLIIVIEPEKSELAKELGFRKLGAYAVKVG